MRIVSLVPCITETVVELGRSELLVGRTRYCPKVVGTVVVGGVWDPDVAAIEALRPDLILADREENLPDHLAQLGGICPVEVAQVRSPEEALGLAARLAELLVPDCGKHPLAAHRTRDGVAPVLPAGPLDLALPVVVPIWLRPLRLLGAGRYGSAMLERAGWRNRVTEEGYPAGGGDDLEPSDARLEEATVLLPTEPWAFCAEDVERYRNRLPTTTGVELVDGRDLFWYGFRTRAALTRLRGQALRLAGMQ